MYARRDHDNKHDGIGRPSWNGWHEKVQTFEVLRLKMNVETLENEETLVAIIYSKHEQVKSVFSIKMRAIRRKQ
jgi:hypothetical protein